MSTRRNLVLVGVGVGVYWISYLVYLFVGISVGFLISIVFAVVGLYIARLGMVGVMKNSIYMAAGIVAFVNLIAIVAFMLVASNEWIEPELADVPGASGGAGIVWVLVVFPIFLGCGLLDLMWVILVCFVCKWKEMWRLGLAFLPILAVWLGALYVDGLHHGI